MALLRNAKPKNTSGSYERIFGNAALGALASKIQSAVISSGSELEAMIVDAVPNIPNLDAFLEQEIMQEGVLLARKTQSSAVAHWTLRDQSRTSWSSGAGAACRPVT